MSGPLPLQFVISAAEASALPGFGPEVAIIGRSNVGKSSLVNALAGRKDLARTSKTPGRTQLLNLYEVTVPGRPGGAVVDLPGYGFAAVPGRTRATWPRMIEGYLLRRDGLAMVMALLDGEIGPTRLDLDTLAWLRTHDLPHQVVATKQDKVKPSKRMRRRGELAQACQLQPDDVVWVSAATSFGIEQLRGLVRLWLA